MNFIDTIVIIVVSTSIIIGLVRGFVKEIVVFLGGILGFAIASAAYKSLSGHLGINNPSLASAAAFVIIFLAVVMIIFVIGMLLEKGIKSLKLDGLDHGLGLLLGIIRGFLICAFLLPVVEKHPIFNSSELLKTSFSAPYILKAAHWMGMYFNLDLLKPDAAVKAVEEMVEKM